MTDNTSLKEKVYAISDEYGQAHEDNCDLNLEGGSDDGCTCWINNMVDEITKMIVVYLSYDMDFKDEEQRKAAVEMYLGEFTGDANQKNEYEP